MKTKYDYVIKAVVPALLLMLLGTGVTMYSDVQQLKKDSDENSKKIDQLYNYLIVRKNENRNIEKKCLGTVGHCGGAYHGGLYLQNSRTAVQTQY